MKNFEIDLIPVLQANGFIAAQFAMINEIETTTKNQLQRKGKEHEKATKFYAH